MNKGKTYCVEALFKVMSENRTFKASVMYDVAKDCDRFWYKHCKDIFDGRYPVYADLEFERIGNSNNGAQFYVANKCKTNLTINECNNAKELMDGIFNDIDHLTADEEELLLDIIAKIN